MQEDLRPIRRALLSVFDKTGIIKLAQYLCARGIELLSTGGTARFLIEKGLSIIEISKYIDFPEIMDGRIKTLHPKIHGGILGRRGKDDFIMHHHNIKPIDMVIVNFYPFSQIIECKNISIKEAIKNIDIGGLAMVRSAAKNYQDVVTIVNNNHYEKIISEMDDNKGSIFLSTRFNLAIEAFRYSSTYDSMISDYFESKVDSYQSKQKNFKKSFPDILKLEFIKKQDIRYGENSHQKAAFYIEKNPKEEASISTSKQLQGKSLSYNNIADAEAALECVKEFSDPACVIVKHTNPCGVSVSDSIFNAYNRSYKADPISAFGGVIAFNRKLDAETAQAIISRQFVEVIIAPSITKKALQVTHTKKHVRILICGKWKSRLSNINFKHVNGGLLVQDRDLGMLTTSQLSVVSKRQPTKDELRDALFGWKVVKFVKSNAIVFAKESMTIGIGAGQMSRVYSVKLAHMKANDAGFKLKGSIMASDAFFAFSDGINVAADGITCVIQPGGSIRDNEVISVANNYGISMIFTKIRHLYH